MSDHGAGRSRTEYDVREYVQEYVYDPIKGSDLCGCSFGERRERVVRCRDCAHMHENPLLDLPLCLFLGGPIPDAGGFCAWGERREDAQV